MSDRELVDVSMQAFRSAMRIAKNEADAEEIRQEALLRFVANPPKTTTNIKGWFGMVGNNIAISRYRHRQVADRKDYTYTRDMGNGQSPDADILKGEMREVVERALDKLPLRNRWIIRLHHFEGLSQDDVSKILGIPLGTVMSAGYRSMQILREMLAPYYLKDAS